MKEDYLKPLRFIILLFLCSVSVAKGSQDSLTELLQRHATFLGGEEALGGIETLTLSGSMGSRAEMLDDSFEWEWTRVEGFLFRFLGGARQNIMNCFGVSGVSEDLSELSGWLQGSAYKSTDGVEHKAVLKMMGQDELDRSVLFYDWLLTPFLCLQQERCEADLRGEDTTSSVITVQLTYDGGVKDLVDVDKATAAVTRIRRSWPRRGGESLKVEVSDYRVVQGIRIAHSWRFSSQDIPKSVWSFRTVFGVSRVKINRQTTPCFYSLRKIRVNPDDHEILNPKIGKVDLGLSLLGERIRVGVSFRNTGAKVVWKYKKRLPKTYSIEYEAALEELIFLAFRQLFPRCEIVRGHSARDLDLNFEVEYHGVLVVGSLPDRYFPRAFDISGRVSVFSRGGELVDRFFARDTGRTRIMRWSEKTLARFISGQAVEHFVTTLAGQIPRSDLIREKIAALEYSYEEPARLEMLAKFDDSEGFFPNFKLDAGETTYLVVDIFNNGPGRAFEVEMEIRLPKDVSLLGPLPSLGDLNPGESKIVRIPVRGALSLTSSLMSFLIGARDRRGYGTPTLDLRVEGAELVPPIIEISNIRLKDSTGRSLGNGDGFPGNGELVEVHMRISNHGIGDSIGVEIDFEDSEFDVIDPPAEVGPLASGDFSETVTLLSIPRTYSGEKIYLRVIAADKRGKVVASAIESMSWQVKHAQPEFSVELSVYDGNTPGSRGNSDGIISNGERVELGVILRNNGNLVAEDIELRIRPGIAGIGLTGDSIVLERLPPNTRAPEQRVVLDVPRNLGDSVGERLDLIFEISQADFPTSTISRPLIFRKLAPQFSLDILAPNSINRGVESLLTVIVQNVGTLSAEDVEIIAEVSSEGLELHDPDLGPPGNKLRLSVGTLASRDGERRWILSARTPQGSSLLNGVVEIRIEQRDFPSIEKSIDFSIVDRVTVIHVDPVEETIPSNALGHAVRTVKPVITFLDKRESGAPVSNEKVTLRFQIQVPADDVIESVLLDQITDQGTISIAVNSVTRYENGDTWRIEHYEIPVTLSYDRNHFKVRATTSRGAEGIDTFSLTRIVDEGRTWVVSIGINDYQNDEIPDLSYARRDGESIAEYYRTQFGLPAAQIFLLTDRKASLHSVIDLLGEELPGLTGPKDIVIIYMAVHGLQDSDSSSGDGMAKYFALWDTVPKKIFSTGLRMSKMEEILARYDVETLVLVIDSCFSGGVGGRTFSKPGRTERTLSPGFLDRLRDTTGRVILTASKVNQRALESKDVEHGLFTSYFLEGLGGDADYDSDGLISVHEVFEYVSSRVSEASNGMQQPELRRSSSLSNEIIIGRVRHSGDGRD